MKRIIFIIALVIAFTSSTMAQRCGNDQKGLDPKKKEMILNAKMKHLQEKLMLSPQQVEQVMPIYKEYLEEISKLPRHNRKSNGAEFTTSEQAYTYIKGNLDRKKTILNIQDNCILKLKDVLNPQQLVSFLRIEHDIQKRIMNERSKRTKGEFKDNQRKSLEYKNMK